MFKRWYQKEGAGKPAPQSGIAYYGYIIYNNFGPFAGLSLVYILCCIPIITIPIATIALNRVFIKLIRDRNLFFSMNIGRNLNLAF